MLFAIPNCCAYAAIDRPASFDQNGLQRQQVRRHARDGRADIGACTSDESASRRTAISRRDGEMKAHNSEKRKLIFCGELNNRDHLDAAGEIGLEIISRSMAFRVQPVAAIRRNCPSGDSKAPVALMSTRPAGWRHRGVDRGVRERSLR